MRTCAKVLKMQAWAQTFSPNAWGVQGLQLQHKHSSRAAGKEVAGTRADKLMCLAEGSLGKHTVILPLLSTNLRLPRYAVKGTVACVTRQKRLPPLWGSLKSCLIFCLIRHGAFLLLPYFGEHSNIPTPPCP